MKKRSIVAAAAAIAVFATAAYAYDFDYATGVGFVGKGEVQAALNWNNQTLQANADQLRFRGGATITAERSWTCTRLDAEVPDPIDYRQRTVTGTTGGVFHSDERTRNQVTGFYLTGYVNQITLPPVIEGPTPNSCAPGYELTTPAGPLEVVNVDYGVQVFWGGTWYDL
jgi:hypothetical protein